MKRLLTLIIAGALLIATSAIAAEVKPTAFNPQLYNEANLPPGILYIDSGKIDFIDTDGIVVDDARYPITSLTQLVTLKGVPITKSALKKGQSVDVYANAKHQAVYVVVK